MYEERRSSSWSSIAKEYDPIKIGSIDETDVTPHDKAIIRAMNSKYVPNKNLKSKPHRTLFVGRLSPRTTEEDIAEIFSEFGKITSCVLVRDIVTGKSRRYAFVEYDSSSSTRRAYEKMNLVHIDSHEIIVDYEVGRTMPGWKPRRLGGGFGGKKESGQLRFGCRNRPFQKPITREFYKGSASEHKKIKHHRHPV